MTDLDATGRTKRPVAVISRLYPAPHKPHAGAFNQQQFRRLAQRFELSLLVPVPWNEWLRHRSELGPVRRDEIDVHYAGWFFPPRMLRVLYPACFALSLLPELRWLRRFDPACLLASWAYPDAVGAAALSRALGIPLLIKAHGRDLKVHARHPLHAVQLRWAARQATALVCVSESLRQLALEIGVPADKAVVIRNGVDTDRFAPIARSAARAAAGLSPDRQSILYVGSVLQRKGVRELFEAFEQLARERADVELIVVGEGAESGWLRKRAAAASLEERMRLVGSVPHADLNRWFNASAVVCVPWHDDNDGLPNVVLEAMACGVPCVASRVCGIPEAVTSASGELVSPGDPSELVAALRRALDRSWDRVVIAAGAERFSWQASIDAISALIERASASRA